MYYVCAGGFQHQQVPADPGEGHLWAVGAVADQEEILHPVQRLRPHMVRSCVCSLLNYAKRLDTTQPCRFESMLNTRL